jgi:hypothetical protein
MKQHFLEFRLSREFEPVSKQMMVSALLAGRKNNGWNLMANDLSRVLDAHKNSLSVKEIFDEFMDVDIYLNLGGDDCRTKLISEYAIVQKTTGQSEVFSVSKILSDLIEETHEATTQLLTLVMLWRKARYSIPLYNFLLGHFDPNAKIQTFHMPIAELGKRLMTDREEGVQHPTDNVKFYYNAIRSACAAVNKFAHFFVDTKPCTGPGSLDTSLLFMRLS